MKAPKRRRPLKRAIIVPPDDVDIEAIAAQVQYVGSPEHKSTPSFAGQPRPRADASLCHPDLADRQEELTDWIRDAIRGGHIGGPWEAAFPRYVWRRVEDVVYEGRLVNCGNGEYKGYPLLPDLLRLEVFARR
ncbi:MAG: hypothetical protein HY319_24220, partial [Armatimonadetes bacterium]|nr:hypothetical protein [Armatimonadota bacterium]